MSHPAATDIELLLGNAAEPFFVLNERGRLVFENRATDELLGIKSGDSKIRERLEMELLAPPLDLPIGQIRHARRPWGEGKHRCWLTLTFVPLSATNGQKIAVLGHISRSHDPSPVTPASDSVAIEKNTAPAGALKRFPLDPPPCDG